MGFESVDSRFGDQQTFYGLGLRHLQAYFKAFCYRLIQKLQKASLFKSLAHLCLTSQRIRMPH